MKRLLPNGLDPILVPVDFSPSSEAALGWAAKAAQLLGAPLLVLHVVHDPASDPGYYGQSKQAAGGGRIEEAAREMFDQFLSRCTRTIPELATLDRLVQELITGLPTPRILERAHDSQAQLIVMGSRGLTGLPRFLLGSQAESVSRQAAVPVTLVKTPLPQEAEQPTSEDHE